MPHGLINVKQKGADFIPDEHGSNPDTSASCHEQGSSREALQAHQSTEERSTSKQGTELFRKFSLKAGLV
jgi:hypothetical protein